MERTRKAKRKIKYFIPLTQSLKLQREIEQGMIEIFFLYFRLKQVKALPILYPYLTCFLKYDILKQVKPLPILYPYLTLWIYLNLKNQIYLM